MNSNNSMFQLNNDFSSKLSLSTDSGHFTPQSFSSGRCTPNSQISSCYDMPNIYGHSSSDDSLPFFCDKNSSFFENKLFQQCTLNAASQTFDGLPKTDLNQNFNKVVSYIDKPQNNNLQYFSQQHGRDDRKFQKNNNRHRRSFNKENREVANAFQRNTEPYEYKNYKENDVSKLFRLFRFLHHLITFEENIGNSDSLQCKVFTIGLSYPNTMHINTHLKFACEISSIVYKSLENGLNQAKKHFSFLQGSKFFMIQFEEHIYAAQEFCNMTIEHKNNVILLSGGNDKLLKLFSVMDNLIEDIKEARSIHHMLCFYMNRVSH
ncbi:hypothetical protein ACFFRR_000074 [Megaselia abdita]